METAFCGIKVCSNAHDTGLCTYISQVIFRLVVFRPFTSEVVVAKVKSSDEEGIRRTFLPILPHIQADERLHVVSIGFFDDMYIPTAYLPQPSAFDPSERAYFWLSEPPEPPIPLLDTPLTTRMYIDQGEVVRVRVEADEFYDDEPGPPNARAEREVDTKRRSPYTVVVRSLPGCALISYITCVLVFNSGTGPRTGSMVESRRRTS